MYLLAAPNLLGGQWRLAVDQVNLPLKLKQLRGQSKLET